MVTGDAFLTLTVTLELSTPSCAARDPLTSAMEEPPVAHAEMPEATSVVAGADDPSPSDAAGSSTDAAAANVPPWFSEWANQNGVQEFAQLLHQAGLTTFVERCETQLTIFAPTNEAIRKLAHQLPADTQLLRELLCVHITMGSLR